MFRTLTDSKKSKCRKKFLKHFLKGFRDLKYDAWERDYKWQAHLQWEKMLSNKLYNKLLGLKRFEEIAQTAVRIETKTNLLFSFEKMALRDAVRQPRGARIFAEGLYDYVYGKNALEQRFENYAEALAELPVVKTRVHTWPLQTVFGFIANPNEHMFLKPKVTQEAARAYGYDFDYRSRPNFETYKSLLDFAGTIQKDMKDLKPADYIDLQSFIWVMGSSEYN